VQSEPFTGQLLYLDPRHLEPDEENVRREPGDLDGLAASLRRFGVLQPLGVAPLPPRTGSALPPDGAGRRYRVVYGNRRREAAILAGLAAVPCVPVSFPDSAGQLVAQLLENLQRRELNDLEKAEGLARLRRQLAAESPADTPAGTAAGGESLDGRVAELVGLSPRTVRRYLALRELPPAVRDLLAEEQLTVTQAQHLGQLPSSPLQEAVAQRAAAEGWTAAQTSRVCAALVRSPSTIDEALEAASGGWGAVERLGPAPAGAPAAPAPVKMPRAPRAAAEPAEDDDDDIWQEDATGTPTPESTGEPDLFGQPDGPRQRGAVRAEPETADGHRVFRIRTLAAFCDEVDRLVRCVQDGDLQRAIQGDASAPTRLGLAAKQLSFILMSLETLPAA
jgi:ParB family chromosome partitioning protein